MSIAPQIVLVTSSQPATNPRVVKEATALSEAGFKVTVVYTLTTPWAIALDHEIRSAYPNIQWVQVGLNQQRQPICYALVRFRRKLAEWIGWKLNWVRWLGYSRALYSIDLLRAAKRIRGDFYIAHNLGGLGPAADAAKHHGVSFGFDFEDYHRGEFPLNSRASLITAAVENHYVPQACYLTAASPLIAAYVQTHFPKMPVTVIQNTFPFALQEQYPRIWFTKPPLKLFWFSQVIGSGRGLESVIKAIGLVGSTDIQLSLLGSLSDANRAYFESCAKSHGLTANQLRFLEPNNDRAIAACAAQHHIGIASETTVLLNRQLCLTNKIYFYLLAGTALLLSSTEAQKNFFAQHPDVGILYDEHNLEALAEELKRCLADPGRISRMQQASAQLAKTSYHWEKDRAVFLGLVRNHCLTS